MHRNHRICAVMLASWINTFNYDRCNYMYVMCHAEKGLCEKCRQRSSIYKRQPVMLCSLIWELDCPLLYESRSSSTNIVLLPQFRQHRLTRSYTICICLKTFLHVKWHIWLKFFILVNIIVNLNTNVHLNTYKQKEQFTFLWSFQL